MQNIFDLTEGETMIERPVGFPSNESINLANNNEESIICLSDDEEDSNSSGQNEPSDARRRELSNSQSWDSNFDDAYSEDDEDFDPNESNFDLNSSPSIRDFLRGSSLQFIDFASPSHPLQVLFDTILNSRGTPMGDTQQVIDVIPSLKINEELKKEIGETSCAICICDMEVEETVRKLPCAHYFHQNCIDQWLKTHLNCPLCKADVGSNTEQVMQNIEKKKKEEEEKAKEAAMSKEERELYQKQKKEEEERKKQKKTEQQRHREQQHARRAQKRRSNLNSDLENPILRHHRMMHGGQGFVFPIPMPSGTFSHPFISFFNPFFSPPSSLINNRIFSGEVPVAPPRIDLVDEDSNTSINESQSQPTSNDSSPDDESTQPRRSKRRRQTSS
eukprot:TRINITY_DN86_c0_g1_i2.p1 TRINITY_DN86_c0_g1~~TRINITY_DN86_c0_g1_i2.p1  ORF type:complete len:389 (+),score=148.33 TRINITY_DN86_c0_g1_i2:181-1347(+)